MISQLKSGDLIQLSFTLTSIVDIENYPQCKNYCFIPNKEFILFLGLTESKILAKHSQKPIFYNCLFKQGIVWIAEDWLSELAFHTYEN